LEFFAFNADYVDKLRAGDAATQEHFVAYFTELIQLKLRSRVTSRETIDDIRQETFARVFVALRRQDGLRNAEGLGSFVNATCNYVLQEHYRSQKKAASPLEDAPEAFCIDRSPSPLHVQESRENSRLVHQALAKLPNRDRDLLRAVVMNDCDKDKACAEMGVSREYLRVLLHRAKQSFRLKYEEGTRRTPVTGK
jgi:RNA polymerase sigma-70 factor, ECF subfamily